MPSVDTDNKGNVLFINRTAFFDRSLEDLRRKGGTAAIAAGKAELVMHQVAGMNERNLRKQFQNS